MVPGPPETTPDVSVIIPVYNGQESIKSCVESVLASQYPADKMELICVDNDSSDGTLPILRSFGSAIQMLQESKRGPGAARNAGLRKARGTFVAFTDADCTVAPNWLANILEPLRRGQACAVGGRILARPGAGAVERFGELIHDHQAAIEVQKPPYLITMNLASRLDLLASIGGFDERWLRMEDVDLSFRLLRAGRRLRYCPEAVIYHHNRDTIGKLMREGFIHGYWSPAFLKVYGEFVRAYRANASRYQNPANCHVNPARGKTGATRSIVQTGSQLSGTGLSPWQTALFWSLFKAAKKAGKCEGRRRPPVLTE